MDFSITVLGIGSAVPSNKRHSSAHAINIHGRLLLFDCGEGTQLQIRRYKLNISKISVICITHLHGDHFFGLPGLLSTMQMVGKSTPLSIYAPPALEKILEMTFQVPLAEFSFPISFIPVEEGFSGILYENKDYILSAFPLRHSVPTTGFILKEASRQVKIKKDFISEHSPSIPEIKAIKLGADFHTGSGEILSNESITIKPPRPRSYAYCSDTAYDETIIPYLNSCDLLYHESTFTSEKSSSAEAKLHSTAAQAAKIASLAGVGKLLLGHFGGEYIDTDPFVIEAQTFFQNTIAASEGLQIEI